MDKLYFEIDGVEYAATISYEPPLRGSEHGVSFHGPDGRPIWLYEPRPVEPEPVKHNALAIWTSGGRAAGVRVAQCRACGWKSSPAKPAAAASLAKAHNDALNAK